MKCPHCGADNAPGERFCGNCGQALTDTGPTQAMGGSMVPGGPGATQPMGSPPPPMPMTPPPAPNAYVSPNPPPAYSAGQSPVYTPPPGQPAPYSYSGSASAGVKDPQTAMLIEIVAGIFGFLGIGHLFAGRTSTGLMLLIGWWVFLFVEVILMAFIIGFCLIPLNFIVPIVSGLWVRNAVQGLPTNIAGINLPS